MLDAEAPPAARVSAANALLDRGFGRPSQSVEVVGTYDLTLLSDDELDSLERIIERATPPLPSALPAPSLSAFDESTD
jgi:hypothetical protein